MTNEDTFENRVLWAEIYNSATMLLCQKRFTAFRSIDNLDNDVQIICFNLIYYDALCNENCHFTKNKIPVSEARASKSSIIWNKCRLLNYGHSGVI